jgi:hypothetical protein
VEQKTTEIIQGYKGYGDNFMNAYTKKLSGTTGHHRVVGYDFGGLKCIVRHQTDGYIDNNTPDTRDEPTDTLSDGPKGLSLSESKSKSNTPPTNHPAPPPGTITIKPGGRTVDISSTLEIKTRYVRGNLKMAAEVYSQLWISQTPDLAVGYHQRGVFVHVQLRDKTEKVREWETAKQKRLRKLAGLLAKIIAVVKHSGERAAVVEYNIVSSSLRIVGVNKSWRALPDDLYERWERKGEVGAENSAQVGQGCDSGLKGQRE